MIWGKWYEGSSAVLARVGNMTLNRYADLEEELDADIEYSLESAIVFVEVGEEAESEKSMLELEECFGARSEFLQIEEIKKIAPYIGVENLNSVGGYLQSGHKSNASANPFLTIRALVNNARRLGAEFHTGTEVQEVMVESGRVRGVRTNQGDIETDVVVNASGAWSADLARLAGVRIPTKPFGEEAVVTEAIVPLPYFPLALKNYGRQTKNGQILIGEEPLPEQEPGYSTETSLDFLPRISEMLWRLFPSFGHINIVRQWAGVEDVTPDGLPILGEVDELEGLILSCGSQNFGFCLSQAVGEIVSDIIQKRDKNGDVAELLNLNRFDEKYRNYSGRWYDD
jgi:sarcosine oxidase subunit beta